tara:strand:- start:320 stop:508 length:189 start_codon:yes stop_codon:yes gene_type:complete
MKDIKKWIMLRLWIWLEQYFEKGNYRFDYSDRIDLQKKHKKYRNEKIKKRNKQQAASYKLDS